MNELQIINQNTEIVSVDKMTVSELLQGKKVCESSDMELDIAITVAIEKANLDLGRVNVDATDHNHLCNTLMVEARKHFSTLTLLEIQAFIENGVRCKYSPEPVYKPTVILVTNWWNAGSQDQFRIDERKRLASHVKEASPEPTADEKFTTGKELSVTLFEKFKKSGQFDRTLLAVYEFCKYYDLIDKDYRKGIYKEALDLLVKLRETESGLSTDLFKRRRLNAELELLKDNIQKDILTVDQHNDVLRSAKLIALKNWFNDLIIEEINFDEFIETKRTIHAR
jgi:hypothetical protein